VLWAEAVPTERHRQERYASFELDIEYGAEQVGLGYICPKRCVFLRNLVSALSAPKHAELTLEDFLQPFVSHQPLLYSTSQIDSHQMMIQSHV
jgi:hypothetical protein